MADPIRVEGVQLPAEGHGVRLMAAGIPVALFLAGGKYYAIDARCSHVGGPLERGRLTGTVVDCPLHGSQFSLETGEVRRGPAQRPVAAYHVTTEGATVVLTPTR